MVNALVQTVRQNDEVYTKKEILQVNEARQAIGMIGNPSEQDFKGMVRGNMMHNFPVTTKANTNMHAKYGPSLESVRGKTVAPVVADYVAVPKEIVERNQIATLAIDVFFVDRTVFLLTVSRQIKLITAEYVAVRTAKSLRKHLERVIQVYTGALFNVQTILMDSVFKKYVMHYTWWYAIQLQQKRM